MSSHSATRHHAKHNKTHAAAASSTVAALGADDTTSTTTTTTTTATDDAPTTTDHDLVAASARSGATTSSAAAADGYMIRAEERLVVGKETVGAGVAALNKFVTTEHVYTSVPVTKEHAVLTTEPITDADNIVVDKIGEAHFEMPLAEERAVASKKAVAVEKVKLSKEIEQTTDVVGAELKKENIAMQDTANVKTRKTYTDGVEQ